MKIWPVGAKLFHVGKQMDRHTEANGRFSQFCTQGWQQKHIEKTEILQVTVNREEFLKLRGQTRIPVLSERDGEHFHINNV